MFQKIQSPSPLQAVFVLLFLGLEPICAQHATDSVATLASDLQSWRSDVRERALVALLEKSSPNDREAAVVAIARFIEGVAATEEVAREVAPPDPQSWRLDAELALSAIKAVGLMGADAAPAVPALTHALAVRGFAELEASEALGRIGAPAASAVPTLLGVLAGFEASPQLSGPILRTFGGIGQQAGTASPALAKHFANSRYQRHGEVWQDAASSLLEIGPGAVLVVPTLVRVLGGTDEYGDPYRDDRRIWAARILGAVGKGARAALPSLDSVAADRSEVAAVREAATSAAGWIRGEAHPSRGAGTPSHGARSQGATPREAAPREVMPTSSPASYTPLPPQPRVPASAAPAPASDQTKPDQTKPPAAASSGPDR